jgi:hypothetical protein
MAFKLKNVVPWGRNLDEYRAMFRLTDEDLQKRIAGFGDGPASFNSELTLLGGKVVSFDPLYKYNKTQIQERINETKNLVLEQAKANQTNFVWKNILDVDHLECIRMSAMKLFLNDFQTGNKRYIAHELPAKTSFGNNSFDLGLSSHFLLLYPGLGLKFHIQSIIEMLRICREVRIFPLLNLDAQLSEMLQPIVEHFSAKYKIEIVSVNYEFQRNGNEMLVITKFD